MKSVADDAVLAVIEDIYAAAASFALWPKALERIADLLGADEASLGAMAPGSLSWILAPRTDESYMRSYGDFHASNHAWHAAAALGVGAVVTDRMLPKRERFVETPFYNEWFLPQGYRSLLGGMLIDQGGWRTVLMLPGRDDFGADAIRLFKTLSPHLARAVKLNIRLAQADADSELTAELLRQMLGAAMLVDADGRLLFANAAAEMLFRDGRGLGIADGIVTATDARQAGELAQSIAACAQGVSRAPTDKACVGIGSGNPISLLIAPIRRRMPLLAPGLPAAIIFDAGNSASQDVIQRLKLRFGLTPAEAQFAMEICKGDGKAAAAARRGISFTTARTHLSRIFDKTGARRQAELVRLILES